MISTRRSCCDVMSWWLAGAQLRGLKVVETRGPNLGSWPLIPGDQAVVVVVVPVTGKCGAGGGCSLAEVRQVARGIAYVERRACPPSLKRLKPPIAQLELPKAASTSN
jgi:hypothetical protein